MTAREAREIIKDNTPKLIEKAKQYAVSEIKMISESGRNSIALSFNTVDIANEVEIYLKSLEYKVETNTHKSSVLSIGW